MQVEGHPIEILAIERACPADPETQGQPLCLFTFRPEGNLESYVLMLTPEQCVRVRDTLDEFLNDPDSWLHLPVESNREMKRNEHSQN